MKKLLTLLTGIWGLGIFGSNSALIVSCSKDDSESSNQPFDSEYKYYGINGAYYITPENAMDDIIENQAEKTETTGYLNKLLLGENTYYDMQDMYDYIFDNYQINSLTTTKNPNDYVMDASGQLSNTIDINGLSTVDVYKDVNGQAVFSQSSNNQASLELAQQSYINSIETEYYADGHYFTSKDEIRSYMRDKYISQDSISQENYYMIGNSGIAQEDIAQRVEMNSSMQYLYDGSMIDSDNLLNLTNFDLNQSDLSKITTVSATPGYFYLQATDNAEGKLSAPSIIESTSDFSSFVLNKNNWQEVDSDSSSAMDFLLSFIVGVVTGDVISAFPDGFASAPRFDDTESEDFNIINIIKDATNDQKEVEYFDNLIYKYGLVGDLSLLANNLNSSKLSYSQKVNILMFRFSESLRSKNVSDSELLRFENLSQTIFASRSSNQDWQDLVTKIANTSNVLDVWKYLVDTAAYKSSISTQDASQITEMEKSFVKNGISVSLDLVTTSINSAIDSSKAALKATNLTAKKIKSIKKAIDRFELVLKVLGWVGVAISILDAIPLQHSETWQLIIPNTQKDKEETITYSINKWIWNGINFDPTNLFSTFTIVDPVAAQRYEYNGLYFATQEDAELRVKKDVLTQLAQAGKVTYTSKDFPLIQAPTLNELITKVTDQIQATAITKYSDHLGNVYDTSLEAYSRLDEIVTKEIYPEVYVFEYEGNRYISKTLEQAEQSILNVVSFDKKTVYWTDLYQTMDYEKLVDVNYYAYNIVSINFKNQTYYFSDQWQVVNFVLNQSNFQNIRTAYRTTAYEWNGMTFENRSSLEKYIADNLQEYNANSEQEVVDYVS